VDHFVPCSRYSADLGHNFEGGTRTINIAATLTNGATLDFGTGAGTKNLTLPPVITWPLTLRNFP
jgi:hypothetical protein